MSTPKSSRGLEDDDEGPVIERAKSDSPAMQTPPGPQAPPGIMPGLPRMAMAGPMQIPGMPPGVRLQGQIRPTFGLQWGVQVAPPQPGPVQYSGRPTGPNGQPTGPAKPLFPAASGAPPSSAAGPVGADFKPALIATAGANRRMGTQLVMSSAGPMLVQSSPQMVMSGTQPMMANPMLQQLQRPGLMPGMPGIPSQQGGGIRQWFAQPQPQPSFPQSSSLAHLLPQSSSLAQWLPQPQPTFPHSNWDPAAGRFVAQQPLPQPKLLVGLSVMYMSMAQWRREKRMPVSLHLPQFNPVSVLVMTDTGASVTTIDVTTMQNLGLRFCDLLPTEQSIHGISGNNVTVHGVGLIMFQHRDRSTRQTCYIVGEQSVGNILSREGCIALGLIPGDFPHQEVAPQEVAPQQVAPQQVAPQQVAPQQVAPQEVAPQEVAPPQQLACTSTFQLLSRLDAAQPEERMQILNGHIHPKIRRMYPHLNENLKANITLMLIEKHNDELVHMLIENPDSLKANAEEALVLLEAQQTQDILW